VTRIRTAPFGLVTLGTAALLFAVSSAAAQNADVGFGGTAAAKVDAADQTQAAMPKPSKRYFIEFRARAAKSYGHAYVIYGTVNASGKIIKGEIAGIHPATESVVPWLVGHLVPVPSETGASDGDSEDIYTTARYRIMLSEKDYKKTVAFIKNLQKTSPSWHAVFYNCVSFIKDIAVGMNLKTPVSNVAYPEVFVNNLREMNTRPDGEAVTSIPYGQWGVERPAEVKTAEKQAASAQAKRKTGAAHAAAPAAAAPPAVPAFRPDSSL
jgi:hypothetical protein